MTHPPQGTQLHPVGRWSPGASPPAFAPADLCDAVARVREPAHVVRESAAGRIGVGYDGVLAGHADGAALPLLATLPALYPEWLGDRSFCEVHAVRYPYAAGEMANGIATTRLVAALGRAGMLGFFGAAGLDLAGVDAAVDELHGTLGERHAWGVNLIHSPHEPELEERVADLLIRRRVPRVSASAFMALTPALVRCAAAGLHRDAEGRVQRARHVFAKVSRPEVAKQFLSPAPEQMLRALVARGMLGEQEAQLAARVPLVEDLTVEADSGGHTDNQPLTALLPAMLALRDEIAQQHRYARPIRVGAAGGLGTPAALAAAFQLGAAYVVTGSVNQCAVEAGVADDAKRMLAAAEVADVTMAPAADMFELGIKVQVLSRGTMFAARAHKLYEAYVGWPSLEAIPAALRDRLEKETLQAGFDAIWEQVQRFWSVRDPAQIARAQRDARHRMALVFRWYLGNSSKWAITGDAARRADYQLWCGPAMGAFNGWCRGSFLEDVAERSVVQLALNLLEGAAVLTRAHQLRTYGVAVPPAAFRFRPRPLA